MATKSKARKALKTKAAKRKTPKPPRFVTRYFSDAGAPEDSWTTQGRPKREESGKFFAGARIVAGMYPQAILYEHGVPIYTLVKTDEGYKEYFGRAPSAPRLAATLRRVA